MIDKEELRIINCESITEKLDGESNVFGYEIRNSALYGESFLNVDILKVMKPNGPRRAMPNGRMSVFDVQKDEDTVISIKEECFNETEDIREYILYTTQGS